MVRYAKRRQVLQSLGGATVVGLAGCLAGDDGGGGSDTWRLGTSAAGGGANQMGSAMGVVMEEHSDQIGISAQTTQGVIHNLRLLDQGSLELSLTHSNVLSWMYNDEQSFADNPADARPVQALPTTGLISHCFYANRNDYTNVTDLQEGDVVSIGAAGAPLPVIAEAVLESEGVLDRVETVNMSHQEAGSAYRAGETDAMLSGIFNYSTNAPGQEVWQTENVDVLLMSDEGLANLPSWLNTTTIDTGHPMWNEVLNTQHDTLELPLVSFLTAMDRDLDPDDVYHTIETLHENQEQMGETVSFLWGYGFGSGEIEGFEFDRWGMSGAQESIPFHPGVADYLQDNDLWNSSWQVMD